MNSVTVSDISSFRNTDVESWITSDGRVYFVQLVEGDDWEGVQTEADVRFFRRHRSRGGINARLFHYCRPLPVVPDTQESPVTVPSLDPVPDGRARAYMTFKCPNGYRNGSKFILTKEQAQTIMNSPVELSKSLSI